MSAHELWQLLVCEIGVPEEKFFEMPLWQIRATIRGYRNREHSLWVATRWQTWAILCALGGKMDSPEELTTFSWENIRTKAQIESEEKELQALIRDCQEQNKKIKEAE